MQYKIKVKLNILVNAMIKMGATDDSHKHFM